MKFLIFVIFLYACFSLNAEIKDDISFESRIKMLEKENEVLSNKLSDYGESIMSLKKNFGETDKNICILKKENAELTHSIDSLRKNFMKNQESIVKLANEENLKNDEFDMRLKNIDSINSLILERHDNLKGNLNKLGLNINDTNKELYKNKIEISDDLNNKTYIVGGAFVIGLILLIAIYFILKKHIKAGRVSLDSIKDAQDKLEVANRQVQEETLKIDSKFVEIIDRQMSMNPEKVSDSAPDHSFALKVADGVAKIELNLSRMDPSIKGYKQLSKAVERIKNNFMSNGYEIVDMLGKDYNEGMRVNADFILDEDLPLGTRKITVVTKPQVNYNGEIIQKATIMVTQNI